MGWRGCQKKKEMLGQAFYESYYNIGKIEIMLPLQNYYCILYYIALDLDIYCIIIYINIYYTATVFKYYL